MKIIENLKHQPSSKYTVQEQCELFSAKEHGRRAVDG
jgi:hypothetical protein